MGKKTRIKLTGKGWANSAINDYHATTGDIIEVDELDIDKGTFIYKRNFLFICSSSLFAIEVQPEKPFEFRAGDKVRCILFGDQVFEVLDNDNNQYPLKIDVINSHVRYFFCRNGFFDEMNKIPFITLAERPKKTVKKTYWVATYNNQSDNAALGRKNLMTLFDSKEEVVQVLSHLKDVQFHEITREVLCE